MPGERWVIVLIIWHKPRSSNLITNKKTKFSPRLIVLAEITAEIEVSFFCFAAYWI